MRNSFLFIGLSIIAFCTLAATLAPALTSWTGNEMDLPARFESPNQNHWLGTDENGSDLFARLVFGARVSLIVCTFVVLISVALGLVIGSIAGFNGGWTDFLISRLIDLLSAFPGFLLSLTLVAMLGPSLKNLILSLTATGWTGFARLVRGEMLHLKESDFLRSAQAVGARSMRQIVRHLWPNLFSVVLVQAVFAMSGAIISESGLSFLGLGVSAETPTWGALLNSGRKFLVEAPRISLLPGAAILLLVLGFNLLGEGLRDLLDPRQRTRKPE